MTPAINPSPLPLAATDAADHFISAVGHEADFNSFNSDTAQTTAAFHRSMDTARSHQNAAESSSAMAKPPVASSTHAVTPQTSKTRASSSTQTSHQIPSQTSSPAKTTAAKAAADENFKAWKRTANKQAENKSPAQNQTSASQQNSPQDLPAVSLENGAQLQAALASANAQAAPQEIADPSESGGEGQSSANGNSVFPTNFLSAPNPQSLTPQQIQALQASLLQESGPTQNAGGVGNAAPSAPNGSSNPQAVPDPSALPGVNVPSVTTPDPSGLNAKLMPTLPAGSVNAQSAALTTQAVATDANSNNSPTPGPVAAAKPPTLPPLTADLTIPINAIANGAALISPPIAPAADGGAKTLTADWLQAATPAVDSATAIPVADDTQLAGQDNADPSSGDPAQWNFLSSADPVADASQTTNTLFGSALAEAPIPTATLPQLPTVLLQQMLQRTSGLAMVGHDSMVVQVEPENLGQVQVSLEMHHGLVSAHVGVESEHVRQLLDGQMQSLRQSLEQQGVQMSGIEVSVQDRQPSLLNPEGQNATSFFNQRQALASGNAAGDSADAASDSTSGSETGRRWGFNTVEYIG